MTTPNKDRQAESIGKLHWAVMALAILMTLGILALAVRVENAGPPKLDRNRIFNNLKSID